MKKIFYRLGLTFFLLLIFFSVSSSSRVEAIMFVPYLDVHIITKTIGGDATFNYSFGVYTPPSPAPDIHEDFSLTTASGTASYFIPSDSGPSNRAIISQDLLSDWELSIFCTSDNEEVTFEYKSDYVSMVVHPFTTITCTFTNTKKQRTPVIIIPGILSSHLNRNDNEKTELWPSLGQALFGWPGDKYLEELSLDEIGQPNLSYPVVLPTDIIRKIRNKDFFDGFIKKLISEGYEEDRDLFIFPYDWRLDIRDSVDSIYSPILISLKDKITQIQTQTGQSKVDIVAHSMGGLLSKYYIKNYGTGRIDKFIDIGTPHLGAPSALKTLMFGDDLGIKFGWFGLNPERVKSISQNMPSAYQLLPSENYFSTSSPDYKYYLFDMDDVDKDGVRGRLDFAQTNQFLKNTGRNEFLLDRAPNIHNDLDFVNPADYGVKAYNIVGCGVPTIGKFFSLGQKYNGQYYDVAYISGDGTVPEKSARGFPSIEEYQVTGVNHSGLTSAEGVGSLISSLLLDKVSEFDFVTYEYISTSTPLCNVPDGDLISFHGPVELPGDFGQNIPDLAYDYIPNNIFIFLPLSVTDQAEIKVTAKKKGKASSHIKKFRNGEVTQTIYYDDLPLDSASSTVEIKFEDDEPIVIDDSIIVPTPPTIEGDSLDDLEPPLTTIHIDQPTPTSTAAITFTTEDDDTLVTEYSIDGGETFIVASSSLPIIISNIGTTTIIYHSTDTSGNIENIQQVEIVILPSPPAPVPEIIAPIVEESKLTHGSIRKKKEKETETITEVEAEIKKATEIAAVFLPNPIIDKIDDVSVEPMNTVITDPIIPYYAYTLNSGLDFKNFLWLFLLILILILCLLLLGRSFLKNDRIKR
ncbi:MAG: hypothetical protein WC027_02045 [Candidatus Paceibacterota bacterium]